MDDISPLFYGDVRNTNRFLSSGGIRRNQSSEYSSRARIYKTKLEARNYGVERLSTILTSSKKTFDTVDSYTDLFNGWVSGMFVDKNVHYTEMSSDESGRRIWNVRRAVSIKTAEGTIVWRKVITSYSCKVASELAAKSILVQFAGPIRTQSDEVPSKESIQGDATQQSSKEENTIITRDQQQTVSEKIPSTVGDLVIASSEPTQQFRSLTNRWMPINSIRVTVNGKRNDLLAQYYIPEDFLSTHAKCAPNTIPFETYVYGKYELEMKFVANGNKFQCGKVIISVKFDSYQADNINTGFQAALSRPHIMLDLSTNNEGVLKIPFRYHRAFVRNQTHKTATAGVRPGKFASIYVQVLSPLQTGEGGANDMFIRPFYRYTRAEFAGMSYKVPLTQMDVIGTLISGGPTPALKDILIGVEKTLDQLGRSNNQDKPKDVSSITIIPKPRLGFPHGKGKSDAVAMRVNPVALTSFQEVSAYPDEPRTTLDIARIWGLRSTFNWGSGDEHGKELFNTVLDPGLRFYDQDYEGQITPMEYVTGLYNFWSGPIELRFDFVSNAFHTGTVIISAEYNRSSTNTDECQSHSTYTKTFHLGEQKSVHFTVPYIYDTVVRRNTASAYLPVTDYDKVDNVSRAQAMGIRAESKMRVKVRVVNVLRPVASTTSTIEVLVYMRGGKNYALHGLKQSTYWPSNSVVPIDSFPPDGYDPVKPPNRSRRELASSDSDGDKGQPVLAGSDNPHRFLPANVSNRWNEYSSAYLPRVQMDTGAKEDEDETANFSDGVTAMGFQSLDTQVSIKDILRRPVLLFNHVELDPDYTGFFIPIMPPSRMMQYKSGDKETSFQRLIGRTPQAAIMNLFRFWRGSLRYTIIIHSTDGHPIYVTHVPHTGNRVYGLMKVNNLHEYTKVPIFGCGLTTEMIIPSVNPSICVEVPFDTENNWAVTFDEDAQRNYSWRDKGDTVTGHLVVTPVVSVYMSVWVEAGDDFEVSNFYGPPSVKTNDWNYAFSDEHVQVQMDDSTERVYDEGNQVYYYPPPKPEGFSLNNVRTSVSTLCNMIGKVVTPERAVKTALCATPYFGSAYMTATTLDAIGSMQNTVTGAAHHLTASVDARLEQLSAKFGDSIDVITTAVKEAIGKISSGMFNMVNYTGYCIDVILDILVAWIDRSWTAVGVGIIRFVTKVLGLGAISKVMHMATTFGQLIARVYEPPRPVVQAPPPTEATLTGALAGILGTLMGVYISPLSGGSYFKNLMLRMTSSAGPSYLVGVLRFVEATFNTVKDMTLNALGYVSPENAALKMLSGTSTTIQNFITDAQLITTEANAALVGHPSFRAKYWNTVMQAYQIQKLLLTVPQSSASPILSRLCSDVIRNSNEKFIDISSSPVRYEPFVICIEGPAGIGKSEIVETLATELLKGVNLKRPHSGATYFRMPGSRFWSGYRDQPVVVYDDWANLTEPQALMQQISELYQLKSTSTFIPEMAHLEEKKIRGNPLIVILLCNHAFPDSAVTNMSLEPSAIYRRRDVLLYAERKPEYEGVSLRDMSVNEQTTFAHLNFYKYKDSTNSASCTSKPVGYELTKDWLVAKFAKWHAQEQIKVQRRMENIRAGMYDAEVGALRLEDPFSLYYSVSSEVIENNEDVTTGFLPSEILAFECKRIANVIDAHQSSVREIVIPDEPKDPFVTTQGDLAGVFMGAALGRVVLEKVCSFSSELINYAVDWIISKHNVTHECCVCKETKGISWYCLDSAQLAPQATHYMCNSCMVASRAANREVVQCPMCRSPNFERWGTYQQMTGITIVGRALIMGLITVDKGVNVLRRMLGGTFGAMYAAIMRVAATLHPSMSERTADLLRMTGALVDMSEYTVRELQHVVTQIDDPFDSDCEDDDVGTSKVHWRDIVTFDFEEDVARSLMREREITNIPCLHILLGGALHHVSYRDGGYNVPNGGTMVRVPELPCTSDCYFSDMEAFKSFAQRYKEEKKIEIQSHLLGFINNQHSHDYYRKRVPRIFQPHWMRANEDLALEISNITATGWYQRVGDAFVNYRTLIVAAAGLVMAVGSIFGMYKFFSIGTDPARVEFVPSGDEITRNLKRTTRTLQRTRTERPHFQQVNEHPPLDSVVKKYVARNYITISLYKPAGRVKLTACGIYGTVALLPRHYVRAIKEAWEKSVKITITPALLEHEEHVYTYDAADFTISESTDLAIWVLSPSFGMFKDIRKFIATDEDLSKPITTEGSLLLAPTNRNPVLKEQSIEILGLQNEMQVSELNGTVFYANDVICYDYSQQGACGSLCFLSRSQRPIVGMHFAGRGEGSCGEGYGVILTKEAIGDILALKSQPVVQLEDWEGPSLEEAKIILPETNVSYIGAVTKEQTPYLPRKTKIRPSLIQNVGDLHPVSEPCILDKTDSRYQHDDTPLVAGCKKHGRLTVDFGTTRVESAKEALWDGWLSKMKPLVVKPKLLTPEEAASGFPDIQYYDPMILNTSAGFPYVATEKKRKEDYIVFERNENEQPIGATIDPGVLEEMKRKSELRKRGVQPITPFIDTLKDERKLPEKVRKYGGTRVFCNPPIDYIVSMRQYYMHFVAAFMEQRFKLMHAVGINVQSTEWTLLASKLLAKGNNICTIDYSNFGPGFNAQIAKAAMELMVRWTMEHVEGVNETEAYTLLHECLNSVHLVSNTLYQQKCGSPSGAPITVVINTLVNILYIFVAWETLVGNKERGQTWESFKQNVELFCYGDDLIMSVTDKYKDVFNALTISQFLAQYGIVATDANKGDEVEAYTTLLNSTFLKHGFRPHEVYPHLWQSALAWSSINDTTQWIWECADLKLATRENCRAALYQAHGHGSTVYNRFKQQVNQALIKRKIQPIALSWKEIDDLFYPEISY